MKSALLGIVLGLGLTLVAVSCSINHRSDTYACTAQSDCVSGRTCVDGFCVVSSTVDGAKADSPTSSGDAATCPSGCTSCNVAQKTCTIDCGMTSCNGALTCPTGYACTVLCDTQGSCRNGVNCQNATSCNITCTGQGSCQNLKCGAGPCDIMCSGPSSCRNVACNNSCACDITCTGNQSCTNNIQCTSNACRSGGGSGCTSVPALCHSCP